MKPPYIDYDAQSQAAYVQLRMRHDGQPFKAYDLDDARLIDLDQSGQIAGVELLGVTVEQMPSIPLLALTAIADYLNREEGDRLASGISGFHSFRFSE